MDDITEVTQAVLYTPQGDARGVLSNCLQSALASALGLGPGDVPNFGKLAHWEPAARLWLRGRGLDWRLSGGIPAGRSIAIGPTARPTGDHAVVGAGGEVAWDPHPSRTGLTGVKYSYVFEEWPGEGPSACWCCGRE